VLLTDGRTLVVDSGVIDAVERSLVAGTPGMARATLCASAYLPPERRGGTAAELVPGDDMYAVGVLAHEMLTGQPPEPECEALDEVRALPSWVGDLIRRCLATDPGARLADAAAALAGISRASWGA